MSGTALGGTSREFRAGGGGGSAGNFLKVAWSPWPSQKLPWCGNFHTESSRNKFLTSLLQNPQTPRKSFQKRFQAEVFFSTVLVLGGGGAGLLFQNRDPQKLQWKISREHHCAESPRNHLGITSESPRNHLGLGWKSWRRFGGDSEVIRRRFGGDSEAIRRRFGGDSAIRR